MRSKTALQFRVSGQERDRDKGVEPSEVTLDLNQVPTSLEVITVIGLIIMPPVLVCTPTFLDNFSINRYFCQATVSVKISNFLMCFCSFDFSCPIPEKDNVINFFLYCIVLSYYIMFFFNLVFVSI